MSDPTHERISRRYLGNHAVTPERSVELFCEDCCVSWTGCAAASCCPECGSEQEWFWRQEFDAEYRRLEKLRP
jgi:hypothetical protein